MGTYRPASVHHIASPVVESILQMPIPSYQDCMLPLLEAVRDGSEHQLKIVVPELAIKFHLTTAELEETLPSGPQPLFYNRVAWATARCPPRISIEADTPRDPRSGPPNNPG